MPREQSKLAREHVGGVAGCVGGGVGGSSFVGLWSQAGDVGFRSRVASQKEEESFGLKDAGLLSGSARLL